MKNKTLRKILSYLLSFVMAIGMIFSDPSYYTVKAYTGSGTSDDPYIMEVDEEIELVNQWNDGKVVENSYDSNVIQVVSSSKPIRIKAINGGTTTIDYDSNGNARRAYITVVENVSISVSPNKVTIYSGQSVSLLATVSGVDEYTINWSSSDNTIVSVDQNGTITGNAYGNAVITASVVVDGKTYSATADVSVQEKKDATDIHIQYNDNLYVDGQSVDFSVGSYQLEAVLTPEDSTSIVSWTTNNADVSIENGLLVIPSDMNIGETFTVTAFTDNGVSTTITVQVVEQYYTVKAEFYIIEDESICVYEGGVSDSKVFDYVDGTVTPDGAIYVGTKSKDLAYSVDLLEDPLSIFDITKDMGENWSKLFSTSNYPLYEVRSAKRAVGGNAKSSQYVYASNNSNAKNYVDSTYWPAEDTHTVPRIDEATITVDQLDNTYTIKYIFYHTQSLSIAYYVEDIHGDLHEMKVISGTMNPNNFGISVPKFTSDAQFNECDAKITELGDLSVSRAELNGKRMELYVDGVLKKQYQTGVMDTFFATETATSTFEGGNFVLKVIYGQPIHPTSNIIQMPVTMYDFAADGMFFEFCSNSSADNMTDKSFAYGMWNGTESYSGQGLVSDTLMEDENGQFGPRLNYTEATLDYIAGLLEKHLMWNGNNTDEDGDANDAEECPDLPTYSSKTLRSKIQTVWDTKGSYADVTAALADGEVTFNEITNCYTAAAYMMTHFFDSDESNGYGARVPSSAINALQLREVTDGVSSYYIYDANWASMVQNGVIQNTVDTTHNTFTDASTQGGLNMAYYMPLDWAGESAKTKDEDQYENADFLFTTVGEGKFVYNEAKNLYFTFKGDDDVYLYINGKLAVDIGGAHSALEVSINLNDLKEELGLVDNEVATFTFFHMERHGTGSNFRMITNIEVTNPSLITDKNAYQNNEMVLNGSIVDSGYPVVYEFVLKNDGDTNMYNLSFVDETLGVRLYPTGYQAGTSKVDGLADQASINGGYATTIGQKLSNAISYGDIQICIYKEGSTTYTVPKNTFETSTDTTYSYQPKLRTDIVDKPAVEGDYGTFGSYEDGQATFVTIADQYKALYPDNEQTEANYQQFLEDLLRNGLDPEVTMILRGFNRTLGQNETFTNRLNTYGTDSNLREIPGTGSTTVRTLNIEPVMFVIDFGKSVTYTESQIFNQDETTNMSLRMYDGENYVLPTAAQPVVKAIDQQDVTYGTGTFDSQHSFTYTLKKFMSGIDTFRFQVTPLDDQGQEISEDALTKNLYMIPATTVYYEDDFSDQTIVEYTDDLSTRPANYFEFDSGIKYFGDWTVYTDESNTNVANQNNDEIGFGDKTDDTYGYDENYDQCSLSSSGSSMKLTYNSEQARLSTATFKFTGTGLEIYSRTNIYTGKVNLSLYRDADVEAWKTKYSQAHFDPQRLTVEIDKSSGSAKVTYRPPEVYKMVESDNLYKSGDLYQIPVITVNDLPYGEYYAVLEVYDADNIDVEGVRKDFYLDAIRISNPLGNPQDVSGYGAEAYKADNEDHAVVTEARSILITESTDFSVDTKQSGAVYIDRNQKITDDDHNVVYSSQDYEDYGPKHEVYLRSGQAIGFNINSNVSYAKVEIGLKVPSMGSASSVEVKINKNQIISLTSATDMYYDITSAVTEEGTIVIANANSNEDSILAITRIKLTGVSYANNEPVETAALFTSNQRTVQLANQYLLEADNTPEEPVTPSEPETPTDPEESETPEEPETPVEPEQPAEEEKPQSSFDKFFNSIKNAIKKVIGSIKGLFPR